MTLKDFMFSFVAFVALVAWVPLSFLNAYIVFNYNWHLDWWVSPTLSTSIFLGTMSMLVCLRDFYIVYWKQ